MSKHKGNLLVEFEEGMSCFQPSVRENSGTTFTEFLDFSLDFLSPPHMPHITSWMSIRRLQLHCRPALRN